MPIKTKIGIAIVAVIAIFSVYLLSRYIHGLAGNGRTLFSNPFQTNEDKQNCATCDPDQDGLTNAEEVLWNTDPFNPDSDGDSFKDGEEVSSGHSPLIPGPDDLINSGNLTDQFSNLTVDGLITGELNPASDSYNQLLGDITSSVLDSGKYLFNQKIDPKTLTTVLGNDSANQSYAENMSLLLQQFSAILADQVNRTISDLNTIGEKGFDPSLKSYYQDQADNFKDIQDEAVVMIIPKPFASTHVSFLSLVQQMQTIDLALANGDEDIIKATLALQYMGDMPENFLNFINDFMIVLGDEKVDMDSLTKTLK